MKTFTDILGFSNNEYKPSKKVFKAEPLFEKNSTNGFINAMSNKTSTENGALTNISTLDAIVDWFYHGAALRREMDENRILNLFVNAFNANPTKALRILFYIRDVRGGQGERRVFRIVLKYLANAETDWLKSNLNLIAEYGRYDDFLELLYTNLKDEVVDYLGNQLEKDLQHHLNNEISSISLLGKWMPSENSSSKITRKYAKTLLSTGKFGSARSYRKALTLLRKDLEIVEDKLRRKDYSSIDYSKLPSYAMLKYSKNCIHTKNYSTMQGAFLRNDNQRFTEYLNSVEKGETKINANTLYPYDIAKDYINHICYNSWSGTSIPKEDKTAELQWKALPDYVPEINGIVVNDTSGSMTGLPMCVSMSLAVYIAERNKSEIWRNYVIPFSSNAKWKEVKGKNLAEKLVSIYTGDCSNTNLQKVFDLILERAKSANVEDKDMPKQIIIISDMEFDHCGQNSTNFEAIRNKYLEAGYTLPTLIWWNVDSRSNQTPVTINDKGCILLSGSSPVCLQTALSGENSIIEAINKIIDQERYSCIIYN
jgi:uncharacterized protein with von Willebrand factor type A (vWA) domain